MLNKLITPSDLLCKTLLHLTLITSYFCFDIITFLNTKMNCISFIRGRSLDHKVFSYIQPQWQLCLRYTDQDSNWSWWISWPNGVGWWLLSFDHNLCDYCLLHLLVLSTYNLQYVCEIVDSYICGKVKDIFNSSRKSSFPPKKCANVLFSICKYEIISKMFVDAKTGYGYRINL